MLLNHSWSVPREVVPFTLLGKLDLHWRNFLSFFLEGVIKNHKFSAMQETENPENVVAHLHSNLPDIFSTNKFLEVLGGNNIKFLYQLEHPNNFLGLLGFE